MNGVGTPFRTTSSSGPSSSDPAGCAWILPKTSRIRNGALEETVSPGRASASSTRTCATGRRAECRARVVVGENLLVRPARVREAERAVLAHADPVAPPAAAHEEGRRGHRSRRGCRRSGHARPPLPPPASAAPISPEAMRARSVRRMVDPPRLRLAQGISASWLLYRTFNSCLRLVPGVFLSGGGGTQAR